MRELLTSQYADELLSQFILICLLWCFFWGIALVIYAVRITLFRERRNSSDLP